MLHALLHVIFSLPVLGFLSVEGQAAFLHGFVKEESTSVTNEVEIRLHIGNPGAEGTANVAAEAKKKTATVESLGGVVHNTTAIEWSEVAAKETYSFFTVWKKAGGAFMGYGEWTPSVAVEVGDTFKVNIGNLTIKVE